MARRRRRHAVALRAVVVVAVCILATIASAGVAGASIPYKPTGVVAAAGARSIHVSWNRVWNDGSGSPITGYRVTVIPNDGSGIVTRDTAGDSLTVDYLAPGVPHWVYVAAHNAEGFGHISDGTWVTPTGPPDRPKTPTGSITDPGVVQVAWSEPYNGGSTIIGYQLNVNGHLTDEPLNVHTSRQIGKPGTTMIFSVRAKNADAGWGPWSATGSIIVRGDPETPVGLKVKAVPGGIDAQWTPPTDGTDGGRPITRYTLRVINDGNDLRRATTGHHETLLGLDPDDVAIVGLTITTYDATDGLGFLDHQADKAYTLHPLPPTTDQQSTLSPGWTLTPGPTGTPMPDGATSGTPTDAPSTDAVAAMSATTAERPDADGTSSDSSVSALVVTIGTVLAVLLLAGATWWWRRIRSH